MIGYISSESALPAAAGCKMPGNFGRTGFLLIAQSQSFALRRPAQQGRRLIKLAYRCVQIT
jgi:hypothetical protein